MNIPVRRKNCEKGSISELVLFFCAILFGFILYGESIGSATNGTFLQTAANFGTALHGEPSARSLNPTTAASNSSNGDTVGNRSMGVGDGSGDDTGRNHGITAGGGTQGAREAMPGQRTGRPGETQPYFQLIP